MNEEYSINNQIVIDKSGLFDVETSIQYINCIKCSALIRYTGSTTCSACSSKNITSLKNQDKFINK